MDESTKPYISRFATESFAFLIRSFRDPSAVIDFLLIHCKKYPNLAPGIGELMFEAVKNINHTLHSFFDKVNFRTFKSLFWVELIRLMLVTFSVLYDFTGSTSKWRFQRKFHPFMHIHHDGTSWEVSDERNQSSILDSSSRKKKNLFAFKTQFCRNWFC